MKRTTIRLRNDQAVALRVLALARDVTVSSLVRDAVDEWRRAQHVRGVPDDEWQRRFDELLDRRERLSAGQRRDDADVERDAIEAVREVRKARAARWC